MWQNAVFMGSTGSLRYNLFAGNVSIDDTYSVSPFKDTFARATGVPGIVLAKMLSGVRMLQDAPRDYRNSDRTLALSSVP